MKLELNKLNRSAILPGNVKIIIGHGLESSLDLEFEKIISDHHNVSSIYTEGVARGREVVPPPLPLAAQSSRPLAAGFEKKFLFSKSDDRALEHDTRGFVQKRLQKLKTGHGATCLKTVSWYRY